MREEDGRALSCNGDTASVAEVSIDGHGLGPGRVSVVLDHVGISDSDVLLASSGGIWIPGWRAVGRVSEVGDDVRRVVPGDEVVIDATVRCGVCQQCRSGDAHPCVEAVRLGVFEPYPGWRGERVVINESNMEPLPEGLGEVAVVLPLAGLALRALRSGRFLGGDSVLVWGLGELGLLTVALARCLGASSIVCVSNNSADLALAAELGGTQFLPDDALPALDTIESGWVEGLGPDVVVVADRGEGVLSRVIDVTGVRSRLVVLEVAPEEVMDLRDYIPQFLFKEINISSVISCAPDDLRRVVRMADASLLPLHKLPLKRLGLESLDRSPGQVRVPSSASDRTRYSFVDLRRVPAQDL